MSWSPSLRALGITSRVVLSLLWAYPDFVETSGIACRAVRSSALAQPRAHIDAQSGSDIHSFMAIRYAVLIAFVFRLSLLVLFYVLDKGGSKDAPSRGSFCLQNAVLT